MSVAQRKILRALTLGISLTGCSHFSRVSAGPVVMVGDRRAAGGAGVIAESVVGSTSRKDVFKGVGAGARVAVTHRAFAVAPFVGPYVGESSDRVFVDASVRLGPGAQYTDGHVLGLGSAGLALGFGYAISDSGWRLAPLFPNPWVVDQPLRPGGPDLAALIAADEARRREELTRSRTLITFSLAADADLRFTRGPLLTTSALVGIGWLDEVK